MAISGINSGRTTLLLSGDSLLSALRRTQRDLLDAQNAISTGKDVNKPSDAPSSTSLILLLQQTQEARVQWDRNLQHALQTLNNTDQAMGEVNQILLEAKGIASSQVGIGSNSDTRANQATVIDAQIKAILDIANRQYSGVSLFGGERSSEAGGQVFTEFLGGIRYIGGRTSLRGDLGTTQDIGINSNGFDAFGGLSTRVEGSVDLDPQASSTTRLADLAGAQGFGIRRGSVKVNIDGTSVIVDLSTADRLGDVVTRINAAIDSVDPSAGAMAINGAGLSLTASTGHVISIDEVGLGGQTAADLGVKLTANGAAVNGGDLGARLTMHTRLSDLGAPIDWAGGLLLTQGAHTKVADFSAAQTVEDVVNVINALGLGLRMEINAAGSGLNLVSEVSGLELSIGENGGTTAGDLGLRTFGAATQLSDFNHGNGLHTAEGDDFAIDLHDGRTFSVDVDGLATVQEVLDAVRTAAQVAGLNVGHVGDAGTDFNVGLAASGNGFAFEDQTAGGGDFRVRQLSTSIAATDLGIYTNAGSGGTIVGGDVAKVRADSVFTHLIMLRDALTRDDSRGITFAGDGIDGDIEQVAKARADVGVRSQRVQQQQERSAQMNITEQGILEDLQGADLTAVITRFTQLTQQLQASLQAGAQNLQTSFLDFLR